MFDRRFYATSLGRAAVASVLAMLAFNIFAITHQMEIRPGAAMAAVPIVELA
jgi:hypothetical protein